MLHIYERSHVKYGKDQMLNVYKTLNSYQFFFMLQALTVAMTFHEKGRAALKQKKISLALPLLLEADAEFRYTCMNSGTYLLGFRCSFFD